MEYTVTDEQDMNSFIRLIKGVLEYRPNFETIDITLQAADCFLLLD